MESAPVIRAQEHVHNAAAATYGNSIVTAGHEHELAASAFREAAQGTRNPEALRILRLLEDQHRRLASLIKEPPRTQDKQKKSETARQSAASCTASPPQQSTAPRPASPPTSATSPTRAPSRRRFPQPSIASNLAEARGIGPRRGTPSNASVSVANALAGRNEPPSTPVRDMLSRHADASKRNDSQRASKPEEKVSSAGQDSPSAADDGFKRFYSAFGSVMSAITPGLGFAALPLHVSPPAPVAEPPPKDPKPTRARSRNQSPEASRTVKSSEPDLAALISKPALRALREDGAAPLGPNESFYLVPTSGGTVSYATILQNPNAPHHPHHAAQNPHLASIDEGDNESGSLKGSSHEEFVDARETAAPPSPTSSRRPRSRGQATPGVGVTAVRSIPAGRGSGLKTMEELSLENQTLKVLVDKQAKRLSMWETTSQSSYNALAQSFRARKMSSDPSALAHALARGANAVSPSSPAVPAPPPPPQQQQQQQQQPDPALVKRLADLEAQIADTNAQLEQAAKEKERLERENKKNAEVLARYRDQWEKLKAGARKRDMEKRAARTRTATETPKESEGADKGDEDEEVEAEEPGFGKA